MLYLAVDGDHGHDDRGVGREDARDLAVAPADDAELCALVCGFYMK